MNFDCKILDTCSVHIGENTLIGPGVMLCTAVHPTDPTTERLLGKESGKPITIGENVWLDAGVIVCPGVSIGDHLRIGAGSVVTRDIGNDCVAVGNPCRMIRTVNPSPSSL